MANFSFEPIAVATKPHTTTTPTHCSVSVPKLTGNAKEDLIALCETQPDKFWKAGMPEGNRMCQLDWVAHHFFTEWNEILKTIGIDSATVRSTLYRLSKTAETRQEAMERIRSWLTP